MRRASSYLALLAIVAVCWGCGRRDAQPPSPAAAPTASAAASAQLREVTLPDLARASDTVKKQLHERYDALEAARANTATPRAELGDAFGRYGMVLMAAEYHREAEAAFLNAEMLSPGQMRWPYYLGTVYKTLGDAAKSGAAFERAVAIDGNYPAALVRLGNAYLDQGRPDAAEPLFAKAQSIQPREVAARFGLGRAALARRDYTAAISHFEAALALSTEGESIHYPLALAYRGAGQLEKAQAHLKTQAGSEIGPSDPVLEEVETLLETPVAYELRGARALEEGRWPDAAEHFRKGVALAPNEPSLRHKLATALALSGDGAAAVATLEETVRRFPAFAKAHYSLGLLLVENGQLARGINELTEAVRHEPTYVEARLQLAHTLRRSGRPEAALPHYARVAEIDARVAEAPYGAAMALVALRRYAEARDRLADGMRLHPQRTAYPIALARVLAAAPDDRVRDGQRALMLLEGVPAPATQTLDWGLAMAMALAEVGRFDDAVMLQREALGFAARMQDPRLTQRLTERLRLFEQRRPSRQPWSDAEPMEMLDTPPGS